MIWEFQRSKFGMDERVWDIWSLRQEYETRCIKSNDIVLIWLIKARVEVGSHETTWGTGTGYNSLHCILYDITITNTLSICDWWFFWTFDFWDKNIKWGTTEYDQMWFNIQIPVIPTQKKNGPKSCQWKISEAHKTRS